MSDPEKTARTPDPSRGYRGIFVILAAIAGLLVGAALLSASLINASVAEAGSRWFGHGAHGERGFDPERARDHAEFAAGWALRHLDATGEQTERIQQVVASVIDEMSQLAGPHREHREALLALLSEPEIDRAELEALRAAELELAETASSVLTAALADVAETLTPEQRADLIEHASRHRGHRGYGGCCD